MRKKQRTEFIGVRLTPAERAALESLANERTASMGSVLRWAVRMAVMGEPPGSHQVDNEGSAVRLDNCGASPLVQS